jgi:hypothetical protein
MILIDIQTLVAVELGISEEATRSAMKQQSDDQRWLAITFQVLLRLS